MRELAAVKRRSTHKAAMDSERISATFDAFDNATRRIYVTREMIVKWLETCTCQCPRFSDISRTLMDHLIIKTNTRVILVDVQRQPT